MANGAGMPAHPSGAGAATLLPAPRTLLWLFVLFSVAWFATLGYRHLIPSDEGRYAEIAREMLASSDWVTPRYNDYKYFYKPPLQAWMTALAYSWFGIGEWQARLWTGLTGWLGIIMIGFTGWRLFGPLAGVLAAATLAGAPLWSIGGHFNALDMGLAVMLEGALCALLLAQRPGLNMLAQRNWMKLCWAFMALAVLSKGLIGIVLPGIVLVGYTLLARDWRLWGRLHFAAGLTVFLLIAAPWFILVSLRNPEFAHFFFIHEHFERFTTDTHRRTAHALFFAPLIIIGFLPWLAALPGAARAAWRNAPKANGFRPELLALLWAVLIFAFFSASKSKLSGYIIPVFPALALLAGSWLARLAETAASRSDTIPLSWRGTLIVLGLLAVAGAAALPRIARMGHAPWLHEEFARFAVWIGVALAVQLIAVLFAWRLAARQLSASVLAVASGLFATCMIIGLGHDELGRSRSGAELARTVGPLIPDGVPVYSVRGLDHTMPWYLRRTTIMVEATDELAFGIRQEPHKWAPTLQDFIARWHAHDDAFALMSHDTYAELQRQGVPMREAGRDERRVIVRKPHPGGMQ